MFLDIKNDIPSAKLFNYFNVKFTTDLVLKKKDIHWDSFVKRALDLPDVENLTKVEGICIDRGSENYANLTSI